MRRLLTIATALSTLTVASALRSELHAQCTTGCSSSSSCNGTGKAGCVAECTGAGECTCKDDKCQTQPLPPAALNTGNLHLAALSAAGTVVATSLVVDCRGNVVDVLLYDRQSEAQLPPLDAIVLRRSPRPVRIATRE
jgi:hypothetical protein